MMVSDPVKKSALCASIVLALAFSLLFYSSPSTGVAGKPLSWQWKMFLNAFVDLGTGAPNTRPPPSAQFSVIGAGLPRTGTDSLRTALDKLGYRTYHAQSVQPEGHHPVWKDFFEAFLSGNDSSKELDLVVDSILAAGYNATTDFPSCLVVVELARKFPRAKIILSVRDSSDKWAESYGNTVGMLFAQSVREPIKSLISSKIGPFSDFMDARLGMNIAYGPGRRPTEESLARAYAYWIEYVERNVDADRLLLHNSKEGWGPLCEHLEVPIDECPGEPFPHENTKSVWVVMVAVICFLTDYWPYCLLVPGTTVFLFAVGTTRLIWKRLSQTPAKEKTPKSKRL